MKFYSCFFCLLAEFFFKIALNTAHQGSFSAKVNLNDFEPFDPTLLGQGTSVWYFAIAEGDGSRPSLEGQYFYSRYFNLTGSSKSSSSPSPSSGSSSGTKSVITAVRTLTASAIQTVVQKIPSSSSSISSTRAVPLPSSSTFQIFSAEADANEGGGGNQITIVSFQTSTNPQARQTSVSISTLLSTETFNQDTTPQPKATSSAIASTSNKDKMTLYGGGIGGGLACVALIFGIAYLVLRHRTKKRLKEEQESSCTELDTRNMRFVFSPSIQDMGEIDSPTLPAVARPETSTSFGTFGTLGTSILFPTFTDDVGERSTSHWSD